MLGSAAISGIGGGDALAHTTAAYGIHLGMYAAGLFRSAAGGDEPGLVGGDDELGPVAQAELGQDPADMGLGGRRAHHQPAGDLGVGQTLRDEPQHLAWAYTPPHFRAPAPSATPDGRRPAGTCGVPKLCRWS